MAQENYYILEGKEVVACPDITKWARWSGKNHRLVALDFATDIDGSAVRVSTVFLGLNHNFGQGAPLLFETMVFGGALNQAMWRCSTWEQAEEIHAFALETVALTCRWSVRLVLWAKMLWRHAQQTPAIVLNGALRVRAFFKGQ